MWNEKKKASVEEEDEETGGLQRMKMKRLVVCRGGR